MPSIVLRHFCPIGRNIQIGIIRPNGLSKNIQIGLISPNRAKDFEDHGNIEVLAPYANDWHSVISLHEFVTFFATDWSFKLNLFMRKNQFKVLFCVVDYPYQLLFSNGQRYK